MTSLLSLHVSTRGEKSFSNQVLAEFERQFVAAHPGANIKSRFLGDIPHLDYDAQLAGRVPAERHDAQLAKAFEQANELTDELEAASALVIATPMYNWGPPSALKAWLDRIINTRTFYQRTARIAGLPVTVIIASGGLYSEGENTAHDFLRPLLVECFTRIGITDIRFINCDPAGPMEYGRLDPASPESGLSKALGQVPAAVLRAR